MDTLDEAYRSGNKLGCYIKQLRDEGDGSYDPRFEIADEARSRPRDEFNAFMRGLNDAMKPKDGE